MNVRPLAHPGIEMRAESFGGSRSWVRSVTAEDSRNATRSKRVVSEITATVYPSQYAIDQRQVAVLRTPARGSLLERRWRKVARGSLSETIVVIGRRRLIRRRFIRRRWRDARR
jgi:hypothetical protein